MKQYVVTVTYLVTAESYEQAEEKYQDGDMTVDGHDIEEVN